MRGLTGGLWGGAVNNWHEMNCHQSHCFVEHKTIRRRWFIAAGRTRALLCVHIVCVLMELWCLSRSISKMQSHDNAPKSGWSLETETFPAFFPLYPVLNLSHFLLPLILSQLSPSPRACHFLIHSLFMCLCCPSLSFSVRMFDSLSLPSSFLPRIFPCHHTHSLSLSLPWNQTKRGPCSFSQMQEEGERCSSVGVGGVFVVKLTCAVFTKRMSWAGLCPGSTVCMTLSFVMHWPVHLLLPKCCPGSHPNSLLILSALRLRGKTQAQNGCHCHCTVLSVRVCMHCFRKNKIMQVLECRI